MPLHPAASRWVQLLLGLLVMMAVSSPQYVWTLFVKPFQAATGAGLPTVQITFSVLIVLQTLEQNPIKLYHSRRRRSSLCIRQI